MPDTNIRYRADSQEFVRSLSSNTVSTCVFDPQYRGVLDKLNYGNEGARQTGRVELPQMTNEYIVDMIALIEDKLKPSGYMFLWVDKFHLMNMKEFLTKSYLEVVDVIVWHKSRMGMGYRSRRVSEYLIVLQKLPKKAKATWTDHSIPDVWIEKIVDKNHPHKKPIGLTTSLIKATTKEGDLVLDPCAGSFVTHEVCTATGRDFLGCDILTGTEEFTPEPINDQPIISSCNVSQDL